MTRILQAASLFLLVAVIALRPLVSESFDSEGNSITRAVAELADPSPVRTLGFDLIILASACLWLIAVALKPTGNYRWTALEIGLGLLIIAGGISCYFAGNKRLAINGTVDWICLPILAITLTQLLDCGWRRALVISVIMASAAVNATQCYEQYFVGFSETIEQYEAGKAEFWAQQGVDLESPTVDAFERRLRAREGSGFFAHSNIAGAYWMLCTFAGIGILGAQMRQIRALLARPDLLFSLLVALIVLLGIAGAVFLSGSSGALFAGALGVALFIVAVRYRGWVSFHRRRIYWISWVVALIGVVAVVGHGVYHDSLPGWSLTFRWQYWKASASLIADHCWTGVGRENFGRHYTLYKDIASPEEVSNPHNFLVQAAAEWGIPGLLGVLAMLVGVTWLASRPSTSQNNSEKITTSSARFPVMAMLALAFCVVLGKAMLLGSDDINYIYYTAVTTALVWIPSCIALRYVVHEGEGDESFLRLSLGSGLLAFLLQDLISFALFTPASSMTFFALLGVWLSSPLESTRPPQQAMRFRWTTALAVSGLTMGFVVFVFAPVYRCAQSLDRARGRAILAPGAEDPRVAAYRAAALADRLDPTPCVELARLVDPEQPEVALNSIAEAIMRDPYNKSSYRQQARLYLLVAAKTGKEELFQRAIASAKTALSLYPAEPSGLVFLADTEKFAGEKTDSKELFRAAMEHYRQALALDKNRLPWETIRRFHPKQVEDIDRKLNELESWLKEPDS